MDTLLMNAGLTSTGVAIVLILWKVMKTVSGKKLISDCCGRKASIGFVVREMPITPVLPDPEVVVVNPSS
jgi:hypothetical protein